MLLKQLYGELLRLGTAVGAELLSSFATFLQMKVKLVVLQDPGAALALIWASELKLIKHFFVEFVNLAGC